MSFTDWNLSSEDDFEGNSGRESGGEEDEGTMFDFGGTRSTSTDQRDKIPSFGFQSKKDEAFLFSDGVVVGKPDPSEDEDDDDDDEIEWEDADAGSDGDGDKKPAALPTRDVTIDFGNGESSQEDSPKKSKKRKRISRRVYRFESLRTDLQNLLLGLHQSHLLSLVGRASRISEVCSDEVLLHVAHSLIPSQFQQMGSIPTLIELKLFSNWFFQLVNRVEDRRALAINRNVAAGAVAPSQRLGRNGSLRTFRRMTSSGRSCSSGKNNLFFGSGTTSTDRLLDICSFLSSENDENPQLMMDDVGESVKIWNHEKAQLMVTMIRSLGWRARYVCTLDPMKRDLDLDHPLLQSGAVNIFRNVLHQSKQQSSCRRRHRRRKMSQHHGGDEEEEGNDDDDLEQLSSPNGMEGQESETSCLGWVEVRCHHENGHEDISSSKARRRNGNGSSTKDNPNKHGNHKGSRWVSIEISNEWIDQPRLMENLFHAVVAMSRMGRGRNGTVTLTKSRTRRIAYALAVEHRVLFAHQATSPLYDGRGEEVRLVPRRVTDVTQRYSSSWSQSLKLRGSFTSDWWKSTVQQLNQASKEKLAFAKGQTAATTSNGLAVSGMSRDDAIHVDETSEMDEPAILDEDDEDQEQQELNESAGHEAMPTSKAAFKTHLVYVLASQLKKTEVLHPDAKKKGVCGMFKGELVYQRRFVSTAHTAKKWKYHRRQVKPEELKKPVKRVKARKKQQPKGFRQLTSYGVGIENDGSEAARQRDIEKGSEALEDEDDGMDLLYGHWQTVPWSPSPVGPNDPIPVNKYNNIEAELLNPGLVHLDVTGMAKVAKKLAIPYAPCLLGFEGGQGGNRVPTIRGIVVHEDNADLLRAAYHEVEQNEQTKKEESRQQRVLKRWKKLISALLVKERVDREYGSA